MNPHECLHACHDDYNGNGACGMNPNELLCLKKFFKIYIDQPINNREALLADWIGLAKPEDVARYIRHIEDRSRGYANKLRNMRMAWKQRFANMGEQLANVLIQDRKDK